MAKSIDEIRNELINNGYDLESLKGKNKTELKSMLDSVVAASETLSNLVVTPDIQLTTTEEASPFVEPTLQPKPTDVGWTDYVLGLFDKKELENGMPRTDALRRVAELLLGQFHIHTQVIQTPTIDNAGRATVVTTITLGNGYNYQGAADVFSGNTDKRFAVHAVATAETRSEGRALRKALRLTRVLAAEELYGADADEANGTDNRIPSGMLNGLTIMCSSQKINLVKLAVYMGYNIAVPEDLTQQQGLEISNKLAKIKQGKEPLVDVIKE
jgi:hypothetical protein